MGCAANEMAAFGLLVVACTTVTIFIGFFVLYIIMTRNKIKSDEKKETKKEPTVEERKVLIHKRIMDNQWKEISARLGRLESESGLHSDVWRLSSEFPSNCMGRISLADGGATRYDKEKLHPITLFKENRIRLEDLGFEITDDRLWAVFNEA